ncbi:hypothetical protein FLJC2902T_19550 [Flavobacterium limnosediminis JC2902]|uniref:Uncharacterized protein n=1 Tax=Flavobacterium limnosediminis JC2902 TaxID=1341181 RepID=V6SLZ3_9FLAO|nr:hypothetical protein FLJC2902T_19550 [Flavobacterium limnosediminis JC2902]
MFNYKGIYDPHTSFLRLGYISKIQKRNLSQLHFFNENEFLLP